MKILSEERPLSVTEAANHAGMCINTIRKWIYKGLLKASKVGERGHYRIHKSDLDELLTRQTKKN